MTRKSVKFTIDMARKVWQSSVKEAVDMAIRFHHSSVISSAAVVADSDMAGMIRKL